MSTHRQLAAYREIKQREHEQHVRKAYGMLPIEARFPGHCPCGQTAPGPYGRGTVACPWHKGSRIVKRDGKWWNVSCVDRVMLEESRANARFVREVKTKHGWKAYEWTNSERDAQVWREFIVLLREDGDLNPLEERVVDRQEAR